VAPKTESVPDPALSADFSNIGGGSPFGATSAPAPKPSPPTNSGNVSQSQPSDEYVYLSQLIHPYVCSDFFGAFSSGPSGGSVPAPAPTAAPTTTTSTVNDDDFFAGLRGGSQVRSFAFLPSP